MMAFCSNVNNIDRLTVSVAITDFSQYGIVGVSWPIFDVVSKLAYLFSMDKTFQESIQYFIAFLSQTKDFAAKTNPSS